MKRTVIIACLALLLILVPAGLWWVLHRPVPALDGTEYIPALEKQTTVTFDSHAVPYIEAHDELDAYTAQGYITARDRMFQMDILRRTAAGELSEIFGISALPTDRLMRTIGLYRVALEEWEKLSPQSQAAIDAYTKGVNAYLSASAGKLPLEFAFLGYSPRPWRSEDCLAVLKYNAYKHDESWRLDDFRQRVSNKVGEQKAAELFRDDLAQYGLPAPPTPPGQEQQGSQQSGKQGAAAQQSARSGKTSKSAASGKSSTTKKKAPPTVSPTTFLPVPDTVAAKREPASGMGGAGPVVEQSGRHTASFPDVCDRHVERQAASPLLEELAKFGDRAHASDNPRPLLGSAAWAVPVFASKTGGALLACSKDGNFAAPTDWYVCSIDAPGLHVAGATLPGVPGIVIGRNENIAWGSADMKADVQDIFLEQFRSQFDPGYKTPNGWANAEARNEVIPVRFGQDVQDKVWTTTHGPVLLRTGGAGISLAWTGLNSSRPAFEALYKLNHSGSWQDFNNALALYSDPPQMFVYADRWGNVGVRAAGDIPVRAGGGQGTMLNPGWLPKGSWQSLIPFDQLPQAAIPYTRGLTGPKNMAVVAANQQPSASADAMPQAAAGAMYGHQFNPPYRANRLLAAITSAKTPLSLADMNLLQADQYSQLVPVVSKALLDAWSQTQLIDRNCVASINMLIHWDGQLTRDSVQASIYEAFLQTLGRRLVEPSLGRDMATEYLQRWPMWLTQAERALRDKPQTMLPPEERTFNTFMVTTMTQALKSMRVSFDNVDLSRWKWGRIHHALFQPVGWAVAPWYNSYLQLGPVYVGGAAECVNACDVMPDPAALNYSAQTGPTQRMLVDMSDRDKFYQALATGESGQLFSPFRHDQLAAWVHVDLAPIAFSPDQLMREAKHRLTLDNEYTR